MLQGWDRYNLKDNPYDKDPLDPFQRPGDERLYVRVDSFAELDKIDEILEASVGEGKPSHFLIAGDDGTGRTSVANYMDSS